MTSNLTKWSLLAVAVSVSFMFKFGVSKIDFFKKSSIKQRHQIYQVTVKRCNKC